MPLAHELTYKVFAYTSLSQFTKYNHTDHVLITWTGRCSRRPTVL